MNNVTTQLAENRKQLFVKLPFWGNASSWHCSKLKVNLSALGDTQCCTPKKAGTSKSVSLGRMTHNFFLLSDQNNWAIIQFLLVHAQELKGNFSSAGDLFMCQNCYIPDLWVMMSYERRLTALFAAGSVNMYFSWIIKGNLNKIYI